MGGGDHGLPDLTAPATGPVARSATRPATRGPAFVGLARLLMGLAGVGGLGACTALAAGCSSSASDDGTGADAAPEAEVEEASTPDAAGDAAAGDAADADADAGDAADVDAAKPDADAGAKYCLSLVPTPRFCDDFDDGDLTNDWTTSAFVPGAVAALDPTSFTSGPASFHVLTPATNATASNNALVRLTMFAAVSHPKLSFSAFLPAVTFTKGAIAIARLDVALNHLFTLYLRDRDPVAPTAILEEYVGGTTTRHLLTTLPPINAWTRIALDLDLANGQANVSFDAQKALDAEPIAALAGSEATVRLGAIIDGPADAFDARFDDVVVDY